MEGCRDTETTMGIDAQVSCFDAKKLQPLHCNFADSQLFRPLLHQKLHSAAPSKDFYRNNSEIRQTNISPDINICFFTSDKSLNWNRQSFVRNNFTPVAFCRINAKSNNDSNISVSSGDLLDELSFLFRGRGTVCSKGFRLFPYRGEAKLTEYAGNFRCLPNLR